MSQIWCEVTKFETEPLLSPLLQDVNWPGMDEAQDNDRILQQNMQIVEFVSWCNTMWIIFVKW